MAKTSRNPRRYILLLGIGSLVAAAWLAYRFAASANRTSGTYVALVFAAVFFIGALFFFYVAIVKLPAGYRVPPEVDRNDPEAVRRSFDEYRTRQSGTDHD